MGFVERRKGGRLLEHGVLQEKVHAPTALPDHAPQKDFTIFEPTYQLM
jgi:hypothetical protein